MCHGYSVTQLCPTICNPMDCTPPGCSVRGILQTRILEWVAISSSRGSSQPRDGTLYFQCLLHCKQILYHRAYNSFWVEGRIEKMRWLLFIYSSYIYDVPTVYHVQCQALRLRWINLASAAKMLSLFQDGHLRFHRQNRLHPVLLPSHSVAWHAFKRLLSFWNPAVKLLKYNTNRELLRNACDFKVKFRLPT